MKNYYIFLTKVALMLLSLIALPMAMLGQTTVTVHASKVSNANFTWSSSNGNVTWAGSVEKGALNQSTKDGYAQIGSAGNPSSSITLSTSSISGTITSVVLDCASYNGWATVGVTVGGAPFGTQSQETPSWTGNSGGEVTFSGSASGEIIIKMTNGTGGRAMYIKSITVTYTPDNNGGDNGGGGGTHQPGEVGNMTITLSWFDYNNNLIGTPTTIDFFSENKTIVLPQIAEADLAQGVRWMLQNTGENPVYFNGGERFTCELVAGENNDVRLTQAGTSNSFVLANNGSDHVSIKQVQLPVYTVVFNLDGAGSFIANDDFEEDYVEVLAGTYRLPSATRENSLFIGWNDGTTTYAAGASYTVSADVNFIAQWEDVSTQQWITLMAGFPATTFSCDKPLDFTNVEGITAYIITDNNGTTQEVKKVPAGKGLYIEASVTSDEDRIFAVPIIASPDETEFDNFNDNKLEATTNKYYQSAETSIYYFYGKPSGKRAAFYKVSNENGKGVTAPSGKAVLAFYYTSFSGAKDVIYIHDETTGVETIEKGTFNSANGQAYDLQGRKVQTMHKGIYIVNGQKIVVK